MYNEGFHPPTSFRERVRRQLMEHFPSSLIPELRFFSKVSKKTKIVELGCGDGNFLLQLSRWGFSELEGVEFATDYRRVFPKIVQEDLISYS
jgi:hypothetical protein